MQAFVLTSLNDAWAASETVVDELPTHFISYKRDLRGLLFLLFGITWTSAYEFNPDDGSENTYNYILNVFNAINKLNTNPNPRSLYGLPRFRCLEDYAAYYRHMPGSDGRENMTAALAAEHYNMRMLNGAYFPGLMFVANELIAPYSDRSIDFYPPQEGNPPGGACGNVGVYSTVAFTNSNPTYNAIYGVTLCPTTFTQPTTSSLGMPAANGGTAEIDRFKNTGGMNILHEFVHLVTHGEVTDQHAAYPPDMVTWTNRDWASWVLVNERKAYGYTPTAYLGLSKPALAVKNADNYAILATCLHFDTLDCLGTFQSDIIARRKLPFWVSPRTVEKMRSGELDLTRDDVPTTEVTRDFGQLYESELEGPEVRDWIGEMGKHHSNRFKHV